MGSDCRFALVLAGWATALTLAAGAFAASWVCSDLGAARLVAGAMVAATLVGLHRHVARTNVMLARFVEGLGHRDFQMRFDARGGAGFDALGRALSEAMVRLRDERARDAEELRFREALVDDVPMALLLAEGDDVHLANKAARRLFDRHRGTRREDFAVYGEALARHLAGRGSTVQEIVPLRLGGAWQRAIVRAASVARLGRPVRVVAVEPVQGALDAVEVSTQSDIVRVFTHEILNSLTPVTSLAGTVVVLLGEEEPDIAEARLAAMTLARRAEGLRRFVDGYRSVAHLPEPRRRRFAAAPFAAELQRLFAAEWIDHRVTLDIAPDLSLDADPDLLAQLLLNLLRNAAQATERHPDGAQLRLGINRAGDGIVIEVEDNGAGIPEAARNDVFLPFFTTRPNGSGIGLSLSRQIAVAHGWRIEVGEGSAGGALIRLIATEG